MNKRCPILMRIGLSDSSADFFEAYMSLI